jgi:prepilin signal peptidase PulO-like enzyme (type II secretory pathway)
MVYLFSIFIFIFGLAVGSFLNVVIFRLSTENRSLAIARERFSARRSRCPSCERVLAWYDLVPILSFMWLRGKCRYCQKPISWQYPLVELATGLLFVQIFNFQFSIFNEFSISQLSIFDWLSLAYLLFLNCVLLVVFVYDLKHYIIPDIIIFPAIIISFFWLCLSSLKIGHWSLIENWSLVIGNFLGYLLAATVAAIFFLLIILITRGKGMGWGDVKLVFLMGLILGWPQILAALFLAFFAGAVFGIGLIIVGKKQWQSQIPFGPFLVGGALIALFWEAQIMNFYRTIFI